MNHNYFEGELQLRASKEVREFVLQRMEESKVYVAKVTSHKDGDDFLVSSNDFLVKMQRELPQRFNGTVLLTRKLFSKDHLTGKNIYRLTLLFTELPYRVGDVIEHRGSKVQIVNISTRNVTAKDVKTGKKLFIS